MYNYRITVCRKVKAPAESDKEWDFEDVRTLWVERTENGGKENLYAGRIVHENEVVYTTRYRSWVTPSMYVRDRGNLYRITGTQEEGRKQILHIVASKDDTGDE